MEKGNANNHDCNMVKCKQVGSWHTAKNTAQTGKWRRMSDNTAEKNARLKAALPPLLLLCTVNANHTRTTSAFLQPYMVRTSEARARLLSPPFRQLRRVCRALSSEQFEDRIESMRESEMWFTAAISTTAGGHAYRRLTRQSESIPRSTPKVVAVRGKASAIGDEDRCDALVCYKIIEVHDSLTLFVSIWLSLRWTTGPGCDFLKL